jgi:hypothetical protein
MVKTNDKVQNEINKRTGKSPKCCHLAKSLLWKEDTNTENVKLQYIVSILKIYRVSSLS